MKAIAPAVPFGWLLVASVALTMAFKASAFVTTDTTRFDPMLRDKYAANLATVVVHGAAGVFVLAIGPFQFLEPLRRRFRRLHRVSGRLYVAGIVVAGITGLRLGLIAHGGPLSRAVFAIAAVAWLATAALAVRTAVSGDFAAHRRWTIRNYALTFGAVALRIELDALQWIGFDFETIYPWMSPLAWIPCAAAGEFLARRIEPFSKGLS